MVTRYQTTLHGFLHGPLHGGEGQAGALGEQPHLEAIGS